jgi:hypothetical protein
MLRNTRVAFAAIGALAAATSLASCKWQGIFDLGKNPEDWGQASEIRVSAWRLDAATGALLSSEDWGSLRAREAPVGVTMVDSAALSAESGGYVLAYTGYDLSFKYGPHWYPERGADFFSVAHYAGGVPGAEAEFSPGEDEYISGVVPSSGEYLVGGAYWLGESGGALDQRARLSLYDNPNGGFLRPNGGSARYAVLKQDYWETEMSILEYGANGSLAASHSLSGLAGLPVYARTDGADSFEALYVDPQADPNAPAAVMAHSLAFDAAEGSYASSDLGMVPGDLALGPYASRGAGGLLAGQAAWIVHPRRAYMTSLESVMRFRPDKSLARYDLSESERFEFFDYAAAGLSGGDLITYEPGYPPNFAYSEWMDRIPEVRAWAREKADAHVRRWTLGSGGVESAWETPIELFPASLGGVVHRTWIVGVLEEGSRILVVAMTSHSF